MAWTLEGELMRIARAPTVAVAVASLGLIDEGSGSFELFTEGEWKRGGSETYVFPFVVATQSGRRRYIFKALVAATLAIKPEQQVAAWSERRTLVASHGGRVPKWYASIDGLILEEFIDHDLGERLRTIGHQRDLFDEARITATAVVSAGFRPISFISNMRVRDGQCFWVDFGTDLGESRARPANSAIEVFWQEYAQLAASMAPEKP